MVITNGKRCCSGLLFGLLVFLLLPVAVLAQTVTGTLQGTVSDVNRASVPGVEIKVKNMETGQERSLVTNNEGFYVSSFLPIGRYTVTATVKGFKTTVIENVEVTLNSTRVVDFDLEPSSVSEAVIVTTDAAPINTTNAE